MTTTKQLAEKLLELHKLANIELGEDAANAFNQLCSDHIHELCTAYLKLEKQLEVCREQRDANSMKLWNVKRPEFSKGCTD